MKTAINTRTQEEYDALMQQRKEEGKTYLSPHVWKFYGEDTCVDFERDHIFYARLAYYQENGATIIPYTEFAKANIVEEPDFKALYLEGRELLEEACAGLAWYRTEYPEQVNESDEEFKQRIETFLTKHNVTPNRDGE